MASLCEDGQGREPLPLPLPFPPSTYCSIRFNTQTSISGSARTTTRTSQLSMANQSYETFTGEGITETMVADAARLFSDNYGIWGPDCPTFAKPGDRVKLNARRLRLQCLPEGANTAYTRVVIDGISAGNALVCRCKHPDDGRGVCWVTQLVVHKDYRGRGLAGMLLRALRAADDKIIGIMSSHPLALIAAARSIGSKCTWLDLVYCYAMLTWATCLLCYSKHRQGLHPIHPQSRQVNHASVAYSVRTRRQAVRLCL